ncbi:hypothetical protein Tco_0869839 [Tanacetum coccineum]
MEILIADQITLDDALVAPVDRLKIGKCNLHLSSDVTSKEATLQAEQLKINHKKKPVRNHSSMASGSGADEGNVHTPSRISSSDDEDSDDEVKGMDVEGAKLDEDASYVEDQGNEAVEDTNANLEGRNDVMTDSSFVSSGFVSNMLNPNQDTGVDAIFGQHAEATSLIDTPVTAIAEPSFSALTNRPPTPNPLVIQLQQPPILTPATTPSSSLQNLPNFALTRAEKDLNYKMEANNSINRSDIQRQLYKALNPPLEQTEGPKEEDQEKNLNLPVLQDKRQQRQQERLLQDLRLTKHLLANLLRSLQSHNRKNGQDQTQRPPNPHDLRQATTVGSKHLRSSCYNRYHHFNNNDLEYLLVGKVTNLNVEERIAFNVSLRMFTRSVVIPRQCGRFFIGVESYQKKLNLIKPTLQSNLGRRYAYYNHTPIPEDTSKRTKTRRTD